MIRSRTADAPALAGKVEKLAREHDGTVQSLLRAIALLEILAEDDEGYRLVDLAARAGLSTSTTHRLLTTLEQKQFVQFSRDSSLWFVGVRCFSIGSAFARRRNFATLALPLMRRLRDTTGETVNLGLLDQGDVVFLTQVESRELMRAITRPGGRSPLPCTAMGQALLSAMSEREVAEILQRHGLPRRTPNSIARPTLLHQVLTAARKQGYAVDDEENAVGLRCVAAVIFDEFRRPYAAISIAGPTVRVTQRRVPELGQQAIFAARDITLATGGLVPALNETAPRPAARVSHAPRDPSS
ncbi:MAG: helix-turn-helix domain-containing protein [Acidobacteria bacterium]|nr:helix-turn-helix domain-containing protein [Acidobacteriota bacterium]